VSGQDEIKSAKWRIYVVRSENCAKWRSCVSGAGELLDVKEGWVKPIARPTRSTAAPAGSIVATGLSDCADGLM
jgi:hypothetical protein